MQFSFEERVTLKASRGSWEGVVSAEPEHGPQGPEYIVHPLDENRDDRKSIRVRETDIEPNSGNFTYPNWSVGDSVVLYDQSGVIKAINGNLYDVEVDHVKKHYTITRLHRVRRWRLLIENN